MADDSNVQLVDVTPELAREWLGFNTHNRRLRDRVVKAYAADMANGDWAWNGESIKFAADGTLLDGQHRLAAIAESGATVPTLVVRGLPAATQETMDGGAKRKFADVLQLRGETNATALAAVARHVHQWEAGFRRSRSNTQVTNAQLLQILEKYPWLREVAREATNVSRGCAIPASVIGLCWWLFAQIKEPPAEEDCSFFMARLADGQNLAKGDPIYELRRAAEASRSTQGERSQTYLIAITIKAWNAYRAGDQVGLLRYQPGGARPERFPEPR